MSVHSEVMKKRWKDPVGRAQLSKAMSAGAKAKWADPEKRAAALASRFKGYTPPKVIVERLAELGLTYGQYRTLSKQRRMGLMSRLLSARRDPDRCDQHMQFAREWADLSRPPPLGKTVRYKCKKHRKHTPWATKGTLALLKKHRVNKAAFLALSEADRAAVIYRMKCLSQSHDRKHRGVINRILKELKE